MAAILRRRLPVGFAVCVAASCGGASLSPPLDTDAGTRDASAAIDSGGPESSPTFAEGGPLEDAGAVPLCPPCSPNNVNLPNSNCDYDCSGTTTPPESCDQDLAYAGTAADFAKAIGICQMADATHWGLVSATYTNGYQTPNTTPGTPNDGQHGILGGFGPLVKPREGAKLGVLSSGWALPCDDSDAGATCSDSGSGDPYFKGGQTGMYNDPGSAPPGYPKGPAECNVTGPVLDAIGVVLQIKVPANAQSLSFDFDFYSGEFPEFVCSEYDDSFVAWLESTAWSGKNGDLNASFDAKGNPISVDSAFFEQCTTNTATGCAGAASMSQCSGGTAALQGTGFYNVGAWCRTALSTGGGATGWLTTKAPVTGGETITLQFLIWDTHDWSWDSSVLVDNLRWYGATTTTGTSPVTP
jgi:hypothetical protein